MSFVTQVLTLNTDNLSSVFVYLIKFQAKHDLLVQREHLATLFLWVSKIIKYIYAILAVLLRDRYKSKKP